MARYLAKKKTYRKKWTPKTSAVRVKRIVSNMAEKKFLDGSFSAGGSNLFVFTSLLTQTNIPQGTSANNRIGNKIFVHYIDVNILMTAIVANMPVNGVICRNGFYKNKDPRGTLPASADVFVSNAVASSRATPKQTSVTLYGDAQSTMVVTGVNGVAVVAAGPPMIRRYRLKVNRQIEYGSNVGSISDMWKEDWGFYTICGVLNAMSVEVNYKVVFSDA